MYHKDGAGTHAFRFGKLSDENIKNDKHKWVRGALVDWNGFPTFELRDRMVRAFVNTGTEPKISDAHFAKYLEKAIGKRVSLYFSFLIFLSLLPMLVPLLTTTVADSQF